MHNRQAGRRVRTRGVYPPSSSCHNNVTHSDVLDHITPKTVKMK